MSRQIVATADEIKAALKGSDMSKDEFLKRLATRKYNQKEE